MFREKRPNSKKMSCCSDALSHDFCQNSWLYFYSPDGESLQHLTIYEWKVPNKIKEITSRIKFVFALSSNIFCHF
jgi:hypothetical protein